MKKTMMILLVGALPALALAGGDDSHGHDAVEEDTNSTAEEHGHDAKPHGQADAPKSEGHDSKPHGHGDTSKPDGHTPDGHGATSKPEGHDSKPHGHDSVAGQPGDPADVTRTVEVAMSDAMRFTPDQLTFDKGETVRFTMQNDGQIPHEFVIGSLAELQEHAKMMRSMPNMQHAEANSITLQSGTKGDVVWKFDKAGTVDFACLIPGHLEAGMKGSIKVL